ncbi:MAG TPA: hypothetical protein VFV31_05620 [Chitinophagaceae bacterium]|nr:hypothetical protein [Chitinophagaceae bacterium]
MKKFYVFIFMMLATLASIGQAPGFLNYQGVARNSVGNVLINQAITLRLTIRDGAVAGPVVYQETRPVTTNPFGLFNVQVGSGGATSVTGTISGVNWAVGAKFIQVEIDPNGGTSFINIGTAQLASVPYSLFSSLAGDLVLPFNKTQADAGTLFKITNSNTSSAGATALEGLTNSTAGNANAIIGTVTSTAPGGFSAGVRGINNGTGGLGIGVYGSQAGNGWGVYGFTPGGIGVNGASNTGFGLYGSSNSGTGLFGTSNTGSAGIFNNTNAANATSTLVASTVGTGSAAAFDVNNTASTAFALNVTSNGAGASRTIRAINSGLGSVLELAINNAANSNNVFSSTQTGTGRSGLIQIVNAANSNNALEVFTNGTGWAANILSGNATPKALRTQGGLQFTGIGEAANRLLTSDATGNATWQTAAAVGVVTGSGTVNFVPKWTPSTTSLGNSLIFDDGSSVAVGTTTPTHRFTVNHAGSTGIGINSTSGFSVVDINAASGDAALRFASAGVNQWNIRNQPGVNNLQFFELGGGGERMAIYDGTGNIAIGGSTGAYRLDILHGGSTGILNKSSASFSTIDIDAASGDAALRFANAGVNQWNIRNRPGDDYLEIFELGGGGSRVVIQDGTGNVGIGQVVSPSYKLDVLHGGSTGLRVQSSASFSVIDIDANSGDAALRFVKAGANQWNTRNNPGTDDYQIFELGGGGERLRIENTTGRVVVSNDLHVAGTLSKAAGAFKIDHPLDPENKYLWHSFVESPDMMNIYNGNIVTDATGKASVDLPDYFQSLNIEYRYQLTVIGSFAQAIISKEVANNKFEIATSQPNVKVSWQITGIRNDAFAQKHRIPNSVEKEAVNKGKYLNPDVYNQPVTKTIGYTPDPEESSINYAPKAVNKPAPATTGGSLDYAPKATLTSNKVDIKGTSVEDVPAAKPANKPAPDTKGTSVEDVKKPADVKKPVEEKKTENSSVSEKTKTE